MAYTKKLPVLSKEEFLKRAKEVKDFISPQGKRYKVLSVDGSTMKFLRLDAKTGKPESFSLLDIYLAYQSIDIFTTDIFSPFVPRMHSPARALLLKMSVIE